MPWSSKKYTAEFPADLISVPAAATGRTGEIWATTSAAAMLHQIILFIVSPSIAIGAPGANTAAALTDSRGRSTIRPRLERFRSFDNPYPREDSPMDQTGWITRLQERQVLWRHDGNHARPHA